MPRWSHTQGLSPPTRGSLRRLTPLGVTAVYPRPRGGGAEDHLRHGSIPAHAGEPNWLASQDAPSRVYPRPRGGAPERFANLLHHEGLSPPTRGSRGDHATTTRQNGSIPAHAGEPASSRGARRPPGVYPRPRGGAIAMVLIVYLLVGLSPPTRGSPAPRGVSRVYLGSIPAHAGEPDGMELRPLTWKGLSPPTRGSQRPFRTCLATRGLSPPTRGSLLILASTVLALAVYPRPRGGASPEGDHRVGGD